MWELSVTIEPFMMCIFGRGWLAQTSVNEGELQIHLPLRWLKFCNDAKSVAIKREPSQQWFSLLTLLHLPSELKRLTVLLLDRQVRPCVIRNFKSFQGLGTNPFRRPPKSRPSRCLLVVPFRSERESVSEEREEHPLFRKEKGATPNDKWRATKVILFFMVFGTSNFWRFSLRDCTVLKN